MKSQITTSFAFALCALGCGASTHSGGTNGTNGTDPDGGRAADSDSANPTCTPTCGDAVCGDDGCGGSCGTCGAGTCTAQGQCLLPKAGGVFAESEHTFSQVAFASAEFQSVQEVNRCAVEQAVGACKLMACTAGGAPTPEVSAGTITISGGAETVGLSSDADNDYSIFSQAVALWQGGESLHVAASGVTVPAFSATVTAPNEITVTTPPGPPAGVDFATVTVDRTKDFVFAWSGGAAGVVDIALNAQAATTEKSVVCEVPAASGTVTLPSALLVKLAPGSGLVSVTPQTTVTVTAGDWSVDVELQTFAMTPAGNSYQVNATIM